MDLSDVDEKEQIRVRASLLQTDSSVQLPWIKNDKRTSFGKLFDVHLYFSTYVSFKHKVNDVKFIPNINLLIFDFSNSQFFTKLNKIQDLIINFENDLAEDRVIIFLSKYLYCIK